MNKALRRHFLKESEVKQIITDFNKTLDIDLGRLFGPKPKLELVEAQGAEIFIFNKIPFSARIQDDLFPTLLFNEIFPLLPKIVVDMGAIPHICNGADIMAPGVIKIDGRFDKDDFLIVIDERYGKPLAIGQALLDSETMKTTKQGKIVKNIHHIGDGIWNLIRKLT